GNFFGGVSEQIVFVRGDFVEADAFHVTDGRAETDGAGNIRSAGFKLKGKLIEQRLFECNRGDHVAAALVGRHGLKERGFAVKHADAGGAVHFVAGKGVEIAVERLHVDFQVRN